MTRAPASVRLSRQCRDHTSVPNVAGISNNVSNVQPSQYSSPSINHSICHYALSNNNDPYPPVCGLALCPPAPLKGDRRLGTSLAPVIRLSTTTSRGDPSLRSCNPVRPFSDRILPCRKNEQRPAASRVANGASNATKRNQTASDANRPTSTAKGTPPKKYCASTFHRRRSKGEYPFIPRVRLTSETMLSSTRATWPCHSTTISSRRQSTRSVGARVSISGGKMSRE